MPWKDEAETSGGLVLEGVLACKMSRPSNLTIKRAKAQTCFQSWTDHARSAQLLRKFISVATLQVSNWYDNLRLESWGKIFCTFALHPSSVNGGLRTVARYRWHGEPITSLRCQRMVRSNWIWIRMLCPKQDAIWTLECRYQLSCSTATATHFCPAYAYHKPLFFINKITS